MKFAKIFLFAGQNTFRWPRAYRDEAFLGRDSDGFVTLNVNLSMLVWYLVCDLERFSSVVMGCNITKACLNQ